MFNFRPAYILQPVGGSSAEIIRAFIQEKPLSTDQVNFLASHQKQLSSSVFDPVLKYYLNSYSEKNQHHTTFLLPHEMMNQEAIQLLKKRIQIFLKNQQRKSVSFNFTQKQFLQFKEVGMQELIFWHGNQLLTGAPFFPGGIPPVLFLQWGNLFGVVKYVVMAEEKALKANLLMYFEDRLERKLEQCVDDYHLRINNELKQQNELLLENKIKPAEFNEFLIKIPILKPQFSKT